MKKGVLMEVIDSFSEAGFQEEAERLKHLLECLGSVNEQERIEAAKEIISWCHPKAWGDLNVAGLTDRYHGDIHQWRKKLNELEKTVEHELKRMKYQ